MTLKQAHSILGIILDEKPECTNYELGCMDPSTGAIIIPNKIGVNDAKELVLVYIEGDFTQVFYTPKTRGTTQ